MPKSGKEIDGGAGHVLCVGKPKRGKTRLLGTASRHHKLYVLALEGESGLSTIAGGDFDYDDCPDYDTYSKNLNWFMKNYKKEGYTALGIDSITRMQHYLIDKLKGGKTTGKLDYDQFNEMLATMRKQLDILTRQRDFILIATVHEEDKGTPNVSNWPLLDGAIKHELAGYFCTVVVADCGVDANGKMSYWCNLQGNAKTVAGTRMRHLKGKTSLPNDYKYFINNTAKEAKE